MIFHSELSLFDIQNSIIEFYKNILTLFFILENGPLKILKITSLVFCLLLIFALIGALGYFVFRFNRDPMALNVDRYDRAIWDDQRKLILASKELQKYFSNPEKHVWSLPFFSQCLKNYGLNAWEGSRLNCSVYALDCLNQYFLTHDRQDQKFSFKQNINEFLFYKVLYPSMFYLGKYPNRSYGVTLQSQLSELNVQLHDGCHESYIEQRVYALGENQNDVELELLFDNFQQNIFVDKFQVTVGEYNLWLKEFKKDFAHLNFINDPKKFFLPVTHLKPREMEHYCAVHKRQVLSTQWFDAGTFIPFDIKNPLSKEVFRGGFFWEKKNSDVLKSWNDDAKKEELCSYLFSLECAGSPSSKIQTKFFSQNPSYNGLHQVMGQYFEYLYPVDQSEFNLRSSSQYFSFYSPWNRLGVRAKWDEVGHGLKNFQFDLEYLNAKNYHDDLKKGKISRDEAERIDTQKTDYGVAFRCFRWVNTDSGVAQ